MITADTITDAQIHALHWAGVIDCFTVDMAIVPYHEGRGSPIEWRQQARARCAEILNARAGGK